MPLIVNTYVVPTALYHIAGPNRQAPIVYMIPGNPGLCEFYETFLEELKKIRPEFEYVCPSHIGFDTVSQLSYGVHPGDQVHTLDEQIKHKVNFIKEWVKGDARGPSQKSGAPRDVLILGHSVGAWMVQRIVTSLQDDPSVNIKFVGLITPTIMDIGKSDRGERFVKMTNYISDPGFYLSRASQYLTWLVPQSYIRSAVNYAMGYPPEVALNAGFSLITKPKIVNQCLSMATEEMKRIGPEFEADEIKGFWDAGRGYRIWLFFVKNDHWVSDTTREFLVKTLSDKPHVTTTVEDLDSIIHAFCVRDSIHVATLISNQVSEIEFNLGDPADTSEGNAASASTATPGPGLGTNEIAVVDM